MLSKSTAKLIRSLSIKKYRDLEGLFVVEGVKMVNEAIRSGYIIRSIYTQDTSLFPDATLVSQQEMAGISHFKTPSPALAVLEQAKNPESDKPVLQKDRLYLGLDAIRDPGNFGTIIRIADWFGIKTVYASPDSADLYNPKVIQATMGSLFRVKVIYTDLPALLSETDVPIWGALLKGTSIYQADLSPQGIILIGNEAHGLSPALEGYIDHALFIPPYPAHSSGSESLNAAMAAAIICAAFRRP